jgi:hypothetical protein
MRSSGVSGDEFDTEVIGVDEGEDSEIDEGDSVSAYGNYMPTSQLLKLNANDSWMLEDEAWCDFIGGLPSQQWGFK